MALAYWPNTSKENEVDGCFLLIVLTAIAARPAQVGVACFAVKELYFVYDFSYLHLLTLSRMSSCKCILCGRTIRKFK